MWKAHQPRPRLTEVERLFRVLLSRLWTSWRRPRPKPVTLGLALSLRARVAEELLTRAIGRRLQEGRPCTRRSRCDATDDQGWLMARKILTIVDQEGVHLRHSRANHRGPGDGFAAKVLIEVTKRGQRAIESVTFRRDPAGAAHPTPSRRVREKIDQALREHSGVSGREGDARRFLVHELGNRQSFRGHDRESRRHGKRREAL